MTDPPARRAAFDERLATVNGALALWGGLTAAAVVSASGFQAGQPLPAGGWAWLGGLGLTAGLLALAFHARATGAARRMQLGVVLSLILHTVGAIGLATVSLQTEADPHAKPESATLAERLPAAQMHRAFAPREDAPPRPEFERPVATPAPPPPARPPVPRPKPDAAAAGVFTPEAAPSPLEPARIDRPQAIVEARPMVQPATDRAEPRRPLAQLPSRDALDIGQQTLAEARRAYPLSPQVDRPRGVPPVARPRLLVADQPDRAPPSTMVTPTPALSDLPQAWPSVAPVARLSPSGRASPAPLVDVAPLAFEPVVQPRRAAPASGVTQRWQPMGRRRAGPDVTPRQPPAAPRLDAGPSPLLAPRSGPPPRRRPRIPAAVRPDRSLDRAPKKLAALAPSPKALPATPEAPPPETLPLETPPSGRAESPTPPSRASVRARRGVAAGGARVELLAAGPSASTPRVEPSPRAALAVAPPTLSPRVASAARSGGLSASPLGVPRAPVAAPPRRRQPAPAFAARLRRVPPRGVAPATARPDNPTGPAAEGGAPPRTEAAIELGLRFLVSTQRADGSWSFRDYQEATGRKGSARATGAATGLALLAMLGAGCDHFDPRYGGAVQRGLDYLIDRQRNDGLLFPERGARGDGAPLGDEVWPVARYYSHGIAAIAVSEALGMTGDATLRGPAQRAIDYLQATQTERLGGWRYAPGVNADLSVTGWQLMALRSGDLAGLNVRPETYRRARRFVESCRERSGRRARFCYNPNAAPDDPRTSHGRRPGTVMTAVGLLSMLYLGDDPRSARIRLGSDHLLSHLPTVAPAAEGAAVARISTIGNPLRDTYYWYYATQVMYHRGGDAWRAWDDALRPLLIDSQVREGGLAGSWSPDRPQPDRWSHFGGRHYVTTMNLLSLEVGYRHLPLYGRVGE